MKISTVIALSLLFIGVSATVLDASTMPPSQEEPNFEQTIEVLAKLAPTVVKAVDLETKEIKNPGDWINKSFFQFMQYLGQKNPFAVTLDDALKKMKVSPIENAKYAINNLDRQITANKDKIEQIETKMIDLPEVSAWPGRDILLPNLQSKQEALAAIVTLEHTISDQEDQREEYLSVAGDEINNTLQTSFTPEQIRVLLLTNEGDKFAQAVAVFMNYSPFVAKIKERLDGNLSNATLTKFQGAYLSLIATLRYSQWEYLKANQAQQQRARGQLIPNIKQHIAQDEADIEHILSYCQSVEEDCSAEVELIQNNIVVRYKTIELAESYFSYLADKEQLVLKSYMNLQPLLLSAKSTYTTLSDATVLAAEIRTSITLFDQLSALELPDLMTLTVNLAEFEELAKELM